MQTDDDTPTSLEGRVTAKEVVPAMLIASLTIGVLLLVLGPGAGSATAQIPNPLSSFPTAETPVVNDLASQFEALKHALIRLPVATALAALLAFRPRRKGTPQRQASVIQTQIILAIVGAIVMLVVGASLARAFGIVGAAGLIRYRAKVDDPKDAGVMLSTLAIGLASGVGLYMLAAFASVFVMAVLWAVESIEPEPFARFELKITVKEIVSTLRPAFEQELRRFRIPFELRETTADDVCYEVKVPPKRQTETITAALVKVAADHEIDVKWDKKKDK